MNREKLVHCAEIYKIRDRKINILDTATIRKPKKKETLLFIPGAGGSIWNWKYQLKYFFDKGYRVVAYDPVGHGGSEIVDKYDFENHYQDLLQIIKKLNIRQMVLVSHSSATQIALFYIKDSHSELKKLVLVSVSLYDNDGPVWQTFISLPRIFGTCIYSIFKPFRGSVARLLFFSKTTPYENIKNFIKENGVPHYKTLQIFRSYANFDASSWAKYFRKPTLIISGKEDKLIPVKVNQKVNRTIPNSKFYMLENAGHCCFYEKPALFNRIMNQFLKEQKNNK
ncbi:MAG: alpha/beta fold hydrolase [Candidatus Nanoarchaeia archaeon]